MDIVNNDNVVGHLDNRLVELKDAGNNIQARADAEQRRLTRGEKKEIGEICSCFERVLNEIEKHERPRRARRTAT